MNVKIIFLEVKPFVAEFGMAFEFDCAIENLFYI